MLDGIEEFREHLGGQLTVMLLEKPGKGFEVHELDPEIMKESINRLQQYEQDRLLSESRKD